MKFTNVLMASIIFATSPVTWAGDWTEAEQQLLEWEESCVATTEFDEWIGCFHADFAGWGQGYPVPQTKSERGRLAADVFERTDWELILFKPLSVRIYGDTAVINYVSTFKNTDSKSGEVTIETSSWTDVCLNDGGQWYWIADHGTAAESD